MQLLRRNREGKDVSMQMTSLIDLVFLLVIFFMCVSDMKQLEAEALTLPVAYSASLDPNHLGDRLVVNVCRDGELRVGGLKLARAEVERMIGERAAAAPGPEGRSELAIRIRADADASYRHVQTLMAACARARVWKLSFAAEPGETEVR